MEYLKELGNLFFGVSLGVMITSLTMKMLYKEEPNTVRQESPGLCSLRYDGYDGSKRKFIFSYSNYVNGSVGYEIFSHDEDKLTNITPPPGISYGFKPSEINATGITIRHTKGMVKRARYFQHDDLVIFPPPEETLSLFV